MLHLRALDDATQFSTWRGVGIPNFSLNGPAMPLNTWMHLAVNWGPAGTKMYIDGEVVAASPENAAPAFPACGYLNYWGSNGSGQFLGLIDELHISNIRRSDAEIRDHAWIPEPTSLSMLLVGVGAVVFRRRLR